jgi:hypothetical protein
LELRLVSLGIDVGLDKKFELDLYLRERVSRKRKGERERGRERGFIPQKRGW